MKYRVDAARSRIKKELRRIAAVELEQIAQAVLDLGNEPRPVGVVQLQKDVYRIRVGDYRIIYKVFDDEKLVLIGRIVRRGEDTYRDVDELFG